MRVLKRLLITFMKDSERVPVSPMKLMTFTVENDVQKEADKKGKRKNNRNNVQINKEK